jgi:hypothetical protein
MLTPLLRQSLRRTRHRAQPAAALQAYEYCEESHVKYNNTSQTIMRHIYRRLRPPHFCHYISSLDEEESSHPIITASIMVYIQVTKLLINVALLRSA